MTAPALRWIDERVGGKPYGADVIVPQRYEGKGEQLAPEALAGRISIESAAEGGHEGARELASYYVGRGVGLMTAAKSAGEVVQDFMEGFADAFASIEGALAEEVT